MHHVQHALVKRLNTVLNTVTQKLLCGLLDPGLKMFQMCFQDDSFSSGWADRPALSLHVGRQLAHQRVRELDHCS